MANELHNVAARWTKLGAMFNVTAARGEVDIERLLLDTARYAEHNSRLMILAVTWLAKYGRAVAKHRLAWLIDNELEVEHRATMGLLLDLTKEKGKKDSKHHFNKAIEACGDKSDERALLAVFRNNEYLHQRSLQTASELSKKWGRWMEDFELKTNAIRTDAWIIEHNASLRERLDFGGDARATIMATLRDDLSAGASESELERRSGLTRSAIRTAIEKLVCAWHVVVDQVQNRNEIRLAAA